MSSCNACVLALYNLVKQSDKAGETPKVKITSIMTKTLKIYLRILYSI